MPETDIGELFQEEPSEPTEGLEPAEPHTPAMSMAETLAAGAGARDPKVAASTTALLKKQARLIDLQMRHLKEEHPLRLSHLRGQLSEMRLRRLSQWFRLAFMTAGAFVAVVAAIGVLVLLMDAFSARSVIVEPFDTPPALAARGLSGRVVAGALLDQLSALQAATRSKLTKLPLQSAWKNDIKVEVPDTGLSVGEVERLLRARFGHDIRIEGDLVQGDAGALTLTVRGDGVAPRSFAAEAAAPGDLDALVRRAAEYVYGQSQPSIYAAYLIEAGRDQEAVAFSQQRYEADSRADQPYLLNQWGNALENVGAPIDQAVLRYQRAFEMRPDLWAARSNYLNALVIQGDEEGAWRASEAARRTSGGGDLAFQTWDELTWNLGPWRAALDADARAHGGLGTGTQSRGPRLAIIDQRLHDPLSVALDLPAAAGNEDGAAAGDPTIGAIRDFVAGRQAAEAGDYAAAVQRMEAFEAAYANPKVASNYPGYLCWVAPVEAMAGRTAQAMAVLARAGRYVDCLRFKGDILDRLGQWPAAQGAYTEAIAAAPDLPAGYYAWGAALQRHGRWADAAAQYAEANRRGPHWADPLKAWGDSLALQGSWREAEEKYASAATLAPKWRMAALCLNDARARLAGRTPAASTCVRSEG